MKIIAIYKSLIAYRVHLKILKITTMARFLKVSARLGKEIKKAALTMAFSKSQNSFAVESIMEMDI